MLPKYHSSQYLYDQITFIGIRTIPIPTWNNVTSYSCDCDYFVQNQTVAHPLHIFYIHVSPKIYMYTYTHSDHARHFLNWCDIYYNLHHQYYYWNCTYNYQYYQYYSTCYQTPSSFSCLKQTHTHTHIPLYILYKY